MRTRVIIIVQAYWIFMVQVEPVANPDIEFCINGKESTTENYPNQAAEYHTLAR